MGLIWNVRLVMSDGRVPHVEESWLCILEVMSVSEVGLVRDVLLVMSDGRGQHVEESSHCLLECQ